MQYHNLKPHIAAALCRVDRNLVLYHPLAFVGRCSKIAQLARDHPPANKLDAGKPSFDLARWTWKPSPKAIDVDADEHDREPVDEQKRKIWG